MTLRSVQTLVTRVRRDTSGQDLLEYALLAATLALGAMTVVSALGGVIQGRYAAIASQMDATATTASSGDSESEGAGGSGAGNAGGNPAPSAAAAGGAGGAGDNGNHAGGGNNGNGRGNGS
jgi:Flp pilus assembly pilin Flp